MVARDRPGDIGKDNGTYRLDVADHENPSEAVVRGMVALLDVDLSEIEPLYERIDPEALDAVFEDGRSVRRGSVFFEYCGCEVVVEDAERITIRRLDTDTDREADNGPRGYDRNRDRDRDRGHDDTSHA